MFMSVGLTGLGFFSREDGLDARIHAIMNLFLIPMCVVGALFLPRALDVVEGLMTCNPLTYGVVALRDALYFDRPHIEEKCHWRITSVGGCFAVLMPGGGHGVGRVRDRSGSMREEKSPGWNRYRWFSMVSCLTRFSCCGTESAQSSETRYGAARLRGWYVWFRIFKLTERSGNHFSSRISEARSGSLISFHALRGPCPLMTYAWPAFRIRVGNERCALVSFTVDPDRDTPEVLPNAH